MTRAKHEGRAPRFPLLAAALLASPRGALPESALLRQLDLYLKLLKANPYSSRVTVTDASPAEIVVRPQ